MIPAYHVPTGVFFFTLEVLVFHLLFKSQVGFQQSLKDLSNKNIFFLSNGRDENQVFDLHV